MRVILTLTRRELASYFLSMTGYVIIAAAALLMGVCLWDIIGKILLKPMPMPLNELFFGTWYPWLVLIPIAPLISMRVFALEKATGTFETLMTAPVRDGQVVLAKFVAGLVFYAILWLPLFGCLLTVQHFSTNPPPPDWPALGAAYLGLLLIGGLLLSFGCLASSLTQSQAIAAIIALGFNLGLFVFAAKADELAARLGGIAKLVGCLAVTDQLQDFARGIVDTRAIVSLVTLSLFFLALTLRVVESRRWK
jgi:ABC-2 type transport system permease protein